VIIVGVEETEDNPKRSKQIRLPMIPHVVACAEQLAQSIRGIIDPPLPMLEVRGITNSSDGDRVIVLKVPSSPSAPHGFERPPTAYVRRGANSEPLTMRDMQSMFFERRTRFERVEQRREGQSHAAHDIFQKYTSGQLLKPYDKTPFALGIEGVLFRCSLVPLENLNIDNMPDQFIGVQTRRAPRPSVAQRTLLVELPEWTHQWSRAYRAVEYAYYVGDTRYSRAAIHADGVVDLLSIYANQTGKVYVQLYAAVVAQGMLLCEWMRRWAGRSDIEYSLDGEFILNGHASICLDSHSDEWKLLPWNSAKFGPYSIGPRAGFPTAFNVVECELWGLFGVRRESPMECRFEELFAKLFSETMAL
jgi:hypothetical protein